MSTVILATKLYIPPPRPNVVHRLALIERLNEGLRRKLTLISAPAGFGKTTLLSDWLAGGARAVAWLSLDKNDDDPARFLDYLIAALQTINATIGEGLAPALQSSPPLATEAILTALLNDLAILQDPFVLVLDDYHMIAAAPVDRALDYLVEHLPPHVHLVIATREDPRLPLARLRARDHLTELRAADWRFTSSETATFLSQAMGLTLTADDIARLLDRTEGWITGLQLAALSLQGRPGASEFIQAFAGNHRYIVDYLVEEVLRRQPEPIRNFLLQTAILDRLTGSLCDAVTCQEGGSARLEALERGDLFVVPLDDQRRWYRYQHLFAEMLAGRLLVEQPEQMATLHQRASVWYERHGGTADAIRHALASEDFERAANLIELAVPAMHRNKQEATLLGWLKALPNAMVHLRPVLSVGYAWALLARGELEAAGVRLREAERWLDTTMEAADTDAPVVVNHEEFRRLPALISVHRAAHAQAVGDVSSAVKYARRALDLVSSDHELGRGAATALLGLASWAGGDLETAYLMFADGMASVQRAGNLADVIGGAIALAEIRIAQGRLHEAMRIYERALQLTTEPGARGATALRGTADLYVGMSELYREHDDLHAAMQFLRRGQELGERNGVPQNQYRWRVTMARIQEAQGDLDGALDLLNEAERVYVRDFFPTARPVGAHRARLWVKQGRVGEALGWARERGMDTSDDLSYLREFEHITLAWALLTRYQSDGVDRSLREVLGLLERLLNAADAGGRTGSVIEILILLALAQHAQGDIRVALLPLQRALSLAEPEGCVRTFVDLGPEVARLLREATAREIRPAYAGRLLAAFGSEREQDAREPPLPSASSTRRAPIEPLTRRELDVLRLLRTDLSGPEIAAALVIALSTVHTHTKSIYSKLNVTNRRAAVKRAAELQVL
ncbi:MAG TPA: LuxR C-terminal-related transcriptional regulator [Ktedonobacterales bacterium]